MKNKARSKSLLFILLISGLVINAGLALFAFNSSTKSTHASIAYDRSRDLVE